VRIHYIALGFVIAIAAACGGGPTVPGGINPPPDPGPIVTNAPPVIGKFTVQGIRSNEPANFADVVEDLPINVVVTDPEPSSIELKFNWSAAVGTFTGTGRSVIWKAPADATTPADIAINLEIVETYTSQGKNVENKVTGSTTVRLHNSVKEVTDLAELFLRDFSDSSKDVPTTMRNFQPGCYGTEEEAGQVAANRLNFTIRESRVGIPPTKTTVAFGGVCLFRSKPGDACARVPVYWKSQANRDVYNPITGQLDIRAGAMTEAGPGVDQVAAIYSRDLKQWKLCDSQFDPEHTSLRAAQIRGLVP
jgi:hypothetical protein